MFIYCLVKIIEKDGRIIAAVQFEIKLFDFSTNLNSSPIIFIRTYTVNYRNALDRLRVRMNIILLTGAIKGTTPIQCTVLSDTYVVWYADLSGLSGLAAKHHSTLVLQPTNQLQTGHNVCRQTFQDYSITFSHQT